MGQGAGTTHEKQSWNDQFAEFMVSNEEVKTEAPKKPRHSKKEGEEDGPEGN